MNNFTVLVKEKVLKALYDHNMLDNTEEVVVGFSGGADSVCLLHILNSVKDDFGFSIKAVHINHGIRGEEADADEDFARNFCLNLNVPFDFFKFDCINDAETNKETLEECGRRVRYESFNRVCGQKSKIATAHNANDNAETMIFNITRGTSVKGLCGIPFVRDNIIRPLLYCSRKEIEGYCKDNNLEFVTDSTNLTDEYTRNKIRHLVMPVLEEINPAYLSSFNSLSDNAKNVTDFLKNKAECLIAQSKIGDFAYNRTILLGADKSIVSEMLYSEFFAYSRLRLDAKKIEALYDLLYKSGRLQLYGNLYAEVKKDYFRFYQIKETVLNNKIDVSNIPFEITFGDYHVDIEKITNNSKIVNHFGKVDMIDYNAISGHLVLRNRMAGDKFTLPKRNVTKTLKKLFMEENIPIEKRNKIPVLCDDNGVVWVLGFGVDKRCIATNDCDNIMLVRGEYIDR